MENKELALYEMNEIVALYNLYIDYITYSGELSICAKEKVTTTDEATRFVSKIFRVFMSMEEEEKEVLNKEFFDRQKAGWWLSKYTKEQFDDLFLRTITTFLRRFGSSEL